MMRYAARAFVLALGLLAVALVLHAALAPTVSHLHVSRGFVA